jgi:tetratricopeptide (TPR) repeat protein
VGQVAWFLLSNLLVLTSGKGSLRAAWPFVLLGLATAMIWGHTVRFEFVWDDRQFIQELSSIRSLQNVPEMFWSLEAQSSYPEGFKLFRPLRTAHYALLFALGGGTTPKPWLFHLANILWHGAAAMLLFAVATRLFRRQLPSLADAQARWLAFAVALAFAVHPVVSEVVCWAKSLDDAMAAVFTLAAMRALLEEEETRRGYVRALIWFTLAVYSKISAVPFALVSFLIFHQVRRAPLIQACQLAGGFVAVAAVFMLHRHLVIGQSSQTAPLSGSYAQTLVDTVPAAATYLRLLCGVPPFRIDYSFMPGGNAITSPPVLAGLAVLGLAMAAAVGTFRRPGLSLVAFGLAWLGAFLLPVSNLMPMMQYLAERFLYLPLIGWLWVVSALACQWPRWRLNAALAALLLAVWAGVAWHRSGIWRDEVTLFVQSSLQGPPTPRVQENAVAAIFKLPHVRAVFSLDESRRALRMVGSPTAAQNAAAAATLAEAHRLFPEDATVCSALGILHALGGDPARAVPFFRAAVRRRPADARLWTNLGQACLDAENWAEGRDALTKALALSPADPDALRSWTRLAWLRQDYPAAWDSLRKLKQLEPANREHDRWLREVEAKLQPVATPNREAVQ